MTIPNIKFVKRIAARILGVGVKRIKIKPEHLEKASSAITAEEVRKLIKDGIIEVKPVKGTSRVRARIRHEKRKKGRMRGHGKRKGAKTARQDPKRTWINKIRCIRRYLKYLKDKGLIDKRTYRKLYRMAKGGYFTSLSHLKLYMKEHKLIKE